MRDLNTGKENKLGIKAGGQEERGNVPKQQPGGTYNPQQSHKTQQPLPGKGQNIGGQNIGGQGGMGTTNKGQGLGTGKTDFNKDKGQSWK